MITRANKSSFLSLHVENQPPRKIGTGPFDIRTNIEVPLRSPLFRDLYLTLYYHLESSRGPITRLRGELSEIGWGVPGLVTDDTRLNLSLLGHQIEFDIECSIELKIGSLAKDGISIPLPFPKHRGTVSGWYNIDYHTHFARFHEFGTEF